MPKGNNKKFNKTRGKKPNYDVERKDKRSVNKGDNDVSWYTRYPSLVKAASSIIFNQPYGYVADVYDSTDTPDGYRHQTSIPGVIAYKFLPMYAEDSNANSAINITTKNLYTWIRHANSGAANYESSDLMQYLVTVCSLYTMVEQIKRDIRLVPTFSAVNRYVHHAALRAIGYSDANIAIMRKTQALNVASLNQVIAQLNTFKIPKEMPLLDRHCWLTSNIWKDDDLEKSSYYLFYTNVIAHYDWANRKVEIHDIGSVDLPGKIDLIQNEINNLLAYEDIGIMLGDILKAYKAEGCRMLSPIDMGEVCDAAYSKEALSQFTNAFIFNKSKFDYEIIQNASNSQLLEMQSTGHTNGHLVIDVPSFSTTVGVTSNVTLKPIIVIDSNEPSSEEVIIASRLMMAGTFNRSGNKFIIDTTEFPTEIILEGHIYFYEDLSGTPYLDYVSIQSFNYCASDDGTPATGDTAEYYRQLRVCTALDKVSFNPTLYYVWDEKDSNGDTTQVFDAKFLGKNWITVSHDWLNRLNKGCKQSLFSLPMLKTLESN